MKILNLTLAIVATALTAAAVIRTRTVSNLRAGASPAAISDASESTTASNALSADMAQEVALLREQTRELPRLRNEVGQLRRATNEIAALQKEQVRLLEAKRSGATIPAALPPGFTAKEHLAHMGFATPDNTLQTFFWAMREANIAVVLESWSERMKRKELGTNETKRAQFEMEFNKGATDAMKRFNNFGIKQREEISPTEQMLEVSSSLGSRGMKIRLVLENGAWKIDSL